MDIRSAGCYPVIIVDRFHSFARVADDAIVALLSQMRTLEHGRSLTTVAISSMSYNAIRQAIPPELAFVNSSYGDNHDHIVMSPISYQEFLESSSIEEPEVRDLFLMGGGPDCVYQTLIDEYSRGVDGLSERCVARVSATVAQFLRELDPLAGGVLEALDDMRMGGFNLPKISYLRSNPLFGFVVREAEGKTVSINGPIIANIVKTLSESHDKRSSVMAINVLVVSANPDFDLDVDKEVQLIRDLVDASLHRDKITVNCILAVTPDSFLRGLRTYHPNVVHFSGHGSSGGIVMRGDGSSSHLVQGTSIAGTLKDRQVDLVVLNACFSADYADVLASAVKVVVGTFAEVEDEAALRFSRAFYRTIFDGHSIKEALKDGMNSVELYSLENVYEHRGDVALSMIGK